MNKLVVGTMAVLALVSAVALGQGTQTVLQIVQRNTSESILLSLIQDNLSENFINTLNSTADTWTIFAPSDTAFGFFGAASSPFTAADVTRYHIVNQTVTNLFDGTLLATELLLPSLGGAAQRVKVTLGRSAELVNNNFVTKNVTASNGNVVYLENVLLPPLNFTKVANRTGVFRILSTILADQNITSSFPNGLPFDDIVTTVFAPTDAAFAAADPALFGLLTGKGVYQNVSLIMRILENHIVPNNILYLTDLVNSLSGSSGSSGSDSSSSASSVKTVINLLGMPLNISMTMLSSSGSSSGSLRRPSSDSSTDDLVSVITPALTSPVVQNLFKVTGEQVQNVSNLMTNSAYISQNVYLNDILTNGGVAHAISNILLPNDVIFTVEDVLMGLGCVEFLNLIRDAGLDNILTENAYNYTLFAPTDIAVGSLLRNASSVLSTMQLQNLVFNYMLNNTLLFNLSTNYDAIVTPINNTLVLNVDRFVNDSFYSINGFEMFPNSYQFVNLTTINLEGSPNLARVTQRSVLAKNAVVYAIDNVLVPLFEPFLSLLL